MTCSSADERPESPQGVAQAEPESRAHDAAESDGAELKEAADGLEDQVIEMEIDDDDIYAVIVDEDDNEIGFILLDENGQEQEYYYVSDPEEAVDSPAGAEGDERAKGDELDLGVTREGVAAATEDLNEIYKDSVEVVSELKETFSDIGESLNFLKKPKAGSARPKGPKATQ